MAETRSAPRRMSEALTCPCASGRSYADCCGALHAGQPAADAAALMRSRYSAFVLGCADYLLASWHPDTRPASLDLADSPRWLGLKLIAQRADDADHATVEFVARYKVGGRAGRLHETSRFARIDGHWYYCDGDLHAS